MTYNKPLFGYAAMILSIGFLVRSFAPAHALNGPTISTGSNPIENLYGMLSLSSGASTTIFSNTSSSNFLVTKYLPPRDANYCNLTLDNQNLFTHSSTTSEMVNGYNDPGELQMVVPPGSALQMKNYSQSGKSCPYYIEGHYLHTP